jgi:hypothetical protein
MGCLLNEPHSTANARVGSAAAPADAHPTVLAASPNKVSHRHTLATRTAGIQSNSRSFWTSSTVTTIAILVVVLVTLAFLATVATPTPPYPPIEPDPDLTATTVHTPPRRPLAPITHSILVGR